MKQFEVVEYRNGHWDNLLTPQGGVWQAKDLASLRSLLQGLYPSKTMAAREIAYNFTGKGN